MFGLKRKSCSQGFLEISNSVCQSMLDDLGPDDGSVSTAAYIAAWIYASALNAGVPQERANQFSSELRQGALSVFGRTNAVSLCWSTSFALAQEVWSSTPANERIAVFYERRTELLPWSLSFDQFDNATEMALTVVLAVFNTEYRKWRPG